MQGQHPGEILPVNLYPTVNLNVASFVNPIDKNAGPKCRGNRDIIERQRYAGATCMGNPAREDGIQRSYINLQK
jgi:hypothetical protein